MSDEVINHVSTNIAMLMRVAAQIARRIAEARRQRLLAVQQESRVAQAALAQRIEAQRRLAAPVWGRAMDSRFWQTASAEEAAYVYGIATRFAGMDPDAAMAARRCEAEANERWGTDLRDGEHLDPDPAAAPDQETQERARQAAPLLDGEGTSAVDEAPAEDAESIRVGGEQAVASVITTALDRHPDAASVVATRGADGALELDVRDTAGAPMPAASAELTDLAGRALSPDLLADHLAGRTWDLDELHDKLNTPLLRAAATQPDPDQQAQDTQNTTQQAQKEPAVVDQPDQEPMTPVPAATPEPTDEAAASRQEGAAEPVEGPAAVADPMEPARAVPWDSMEARMDWADSLRDRGVDEETIASALTSDLALSEPMTAVSARGPVPADAGVALSAPQQEQALTM